MPKPRRASSLPIKVPHPLDLHEATQEVANYIRQGDTSIFEPVPTGFPVLDQLLGGSDEMPGGFYPEDLWLLAGTQGVGKTSLALQMAHNMGKKEILAIFICYEHTPITLWERMICQASGLAGGKVKGRDGSQLVRMADLRRAYRDMIASYSGKELGREKLIDELLQYFPDPKEIWSEFTKAASHVWLIKGDPLYTTPEAIEAYVKMAKEEGHRRMVLFVDYVQRIPVAPQYGRLLETIERIEYSLRALKGVAMTHLLPVVGISAADAEGLRQGRVHLENVWGNATMQYEPDGALVLNRDRPQQGVEQVRLSIEKSRRGESEIELRYPFWGSVFRFGSPGERVPAGESWQRERGAVLAAEPDREEEEETSGVQQG